MPSHDERIRKHYAEEATNRLRTAIRLLLEKHLESGGSEDEPLVKSLRNALGDVKADFRSAMRGMKL